MNIDGFINSVGKVQKNGGNKKCWLFDGYALLYGSFKEESLKKIMQISSGLVKQGVRVMPTVAYKVDTPPNFLGYVRGYSLQQKAPGGELYHHQMTETEYKTRFSEIANMQQSDMDKFVSDWLAISDAGLMIDPSKAENFFYDGGKINFIDLNVSEQKTSLQTNLRHVISVLTGLGLKKYSPDKQELNNLLGMAVKSFIPKGLQKPDAEKYLSDYITNNKELSAFISGIFKLGEVGAGRGQKKHLDKQIFALLSQKEK